MQGSVPHVGVNSPWWGQYTMLGSIPHGSVPRGWVSTPWWCQFSMVGSVFYGRVRSLALILQCITPALRSQNVLTVKIENV